MKVLVCGGRDYRDRARVQLELDLLAKIDEENMLPGPDFHVIHGGCPTGADQWADDWCVTNWSDPIIFYADWAAHGKAAGPIRNARMLSEGKPDLVLAFPGGRGTADMVRKARAAGVEVREVRG